MTSEIEAFIKQSLKKEKLLGSIFKKLVTQYPEEARRQHAIRGAIMQYEHQYGPEMKRHDKEMRRYRETRANEFASNDVEKIRVAFRLPDSLVTRINMILSPPIFSDKEPLFMSDEAIQMHGEDEWFSKNFKRYVVPEVY